MNLLRLARRSPRFWLPVVGLSVLAAAAVILTTASAAVARRHAPSCEHPIGAASGTHWVTTWGASPQAASTSNLSAHGFEDQTVREIVFSSVGGSEVRVRFTNAFGSRPLQIGEAAIAIQCAGATVGKTVLLSFAGRRSVVIPRGADVLSDPVRLPVRPLENLAVSIFLPVATGAATQHSEAQQINYVAAGDHALDPSRAAFTRTTRSWYLLDAVDVLAPRSDLGTVIALGDSITDGFQSSVDKNARWPNDLARRLAARAGPTLSVVDEGIGGNRVLNGSPCCGPAAVARFRADVVDQQAAREVIVLEGVNDIGSSQSRGASTAPHTDVSAAQIIAGYERLIAQAHAAGLEIFGATITPFKGARYWTPAGEAKRDAVNRWILTSGAFDGVIDFAKALADPRDPEVLNPAYDSGDHLHPNDAGYRAMADAVSLTMLVDDARAGAGNDRSGGAAPSRPGAAG